MAAVRLEGVVKKFKAERGFFEWGRANHTDILALDHLYLDIREGETLSVVGPSGCGKTTSLKVIAGLETIDQGNVYFNDQNVNEVRPIDRRIGMVFQNYALYPHMISRENLAFPFRLRKWPEYKIDEKIEFTCETLGVEFGALLGRFPKTLSAGQKQRVALGRCIIRNPSVFLMDEPLSNLDAKSRKKTRVEIKRLLNRFRITTVYVTHDQEEAISLADRIAVMRKGRIDQAGTFEEVYHHPVNMFVAEFIGDPPMNFLHLTLKKGKGGLFLENGLRIPLPTKKFQALKKEEYLNKEVILGIRREQIKRAEMAPSSPEMHRFNALVEEAEVKMSGILLFLEAGGHKLITAIDSTLPIKRGDKIELAFDTEKAKIFDRDSQRVIVS